MGELINIKSVVTRALNTVLEYKYNNISLLKYNEKLATMTTPLERKGILE